PGFVDDRTVQGETDEMGKLVERHPLGVQPSYSAFSQTEVGIAVRLAGTCRAPTGLREINRNTSSFSKRLQFGLPSCRHRIHWDVPDFAMCLQAKAIFEKRLKHGAFHQFLSLRSFGFGVNLESFRTGPGGTPLDRRNSPRRISLAIREQPIGAPNEASFA